MAVYVITGKLGGGKGKAAIMRLREYLEQGKRVATNCDVFLQHLMPVQSKATVIRIPDKPSANDLYAIGSGNKFVEFDPICISNEKAFEFKAPSPRLLDGFDEQHNGALILDECGSWLNTRDFQSKSRAPLLEWAIHARKYGWDVYFITQNIKQIDAQLRESLFEYVVRLNRLDRMKVPVVSSFLKLVTAGFSDGSMPRVHIGVVRLGCSPDGLVADRWIFRGDDLNAGYNTTQVFSENYPHAVHSVLSSWHLSAQYGLPPDFVGAPHPDKREYRLLKSRALPPKPPHKHMTKFLFISLIVGGFLGFFASSLVTPMFASTSAGQAPKVVKYHETITGKGYFLNNGLVTVVLSDGRIVNPSQFKITATGWEALLSDDLWIKGTIQ